MGRERASVASLTRLAQKNGTRYSTPRVPFTYLFVGDFREELFVQDAFLCSSNPLGRSLIC